MGKSAALPTSKGPLGFAHSAQPTTLPFALSVSAGGDEVEG
ncbi:MAG TPA: hypothetical protein VGX03_31745 [Candidatus Binatia bacterium]|nr:hypothetical protein [Candidatus Binatia bacterium]